LVCVPMGSYDRAHLITIIGREWIPPCVEGTELPWQIRCINFVIAACLCKSERGPRHSWWRQGVSTVSLRAPISISVIYCAVHVYTLALLIGVFHMFPHVETNEKNCTAFRKGGGCYQTGTVCFTFCRVQMHFLETGNKRW
jgi:hypothetical protein